MKKELLFLIIISFLVVAHGNSQSNKEDSVVTGKTVYNEDDGPIVLKFEPDFVSAQVNRRNAILEKRRIIDSLDISEKKKIRLIKELYKDLNSKRLRKVLLAETKFEYNLD
ncbi:MAG: hypothetical protein WBB27_04835 [Maribacter sp.]